MLARNFSLLFYLKKGRKSSEEAWPIYLRITVNGICSEISTKRNCLAQNWNSQREKAVGSKDTTKALNDYLQTFKSKVYEVKRQFIEADKPITAAAIKQRLFAPLEKDRMLIEVFKEYNHRVQQLIGIDYSKATWTKYNRTREFTQRFIEFKYQLPDRRILSLDLEFVQGFELWLKTVRKCGQNSSMKYISILKMIVIHCVNNQWLDHDPFARFKMVKEDLIPQFLTTHELKTLEEKEIKIERLRQVRDVFLFSCYTGLAYADIQKLKTSEITRGFDDQLWVNTRRTKTNEPSRIPLLPGSQKILEDYTGHPYCMSTGKVLPVLSNQKYNAYLKELADICGISKNLTTHTARHTFATTVTLSNGVPMESVSKMLGHRKIHTTQHYARVLDVKVSENMRALKSKLLG